MIKILLILVLFILILIATLFIIPENKIPNAVRFYVISTKTEVRELMSKNKCKKLRTKHSDWFDYPEQVSWSSLDLKRLGILNEDYSKLTANATEENLYDIGYMWMCGLRNYKENRKELYAADWTYGDDGDLFLGHANENLNEYTILAKAYNRGYNDAQNDRNIPK